ncbi:MAG: type II toxin-antitoxin system HicB family antitoxin [Deltaproteobacteria bacterium]|jgi:predicted RNase H-like HicB family nuclease
MIKNKTFNIIVEQGSDGYLISSVIELPGCHTQAKTYDELLSRTKEAIELYLDTKKTFKPANRFLSFQQISV